MTRQLVLVAFIILAAFIFLLLTNISGIALGTDPVGEAHLADINLVSGEEFYTGGIPLRKTAITLCNPGQKDVQIR